MKRRLIGIKGEEEAIDYIENKDLQVLERNYRKRSGEIDIIAFDPNYNEYVFIEVKTRQSNKFGFPEEAVDDRKVSKIEETGETWLMEKGIENPKWRIDVITVEKRGIKSSVKHIQNICSE